MQMHDIFEGRKGPWMQTSLGGRFFPSDPRPEEVFIEDIANGLAKEERYAGQTSIDFHYSVAEHSILMAQHIMSHGGTYEEAMIALLHDGSEAYIKDLPRAVKEAMGAGYRAVEEKVQGAIYTRFRLTDAYENYKDVLKDIDRRMIPVEKKKLMAHQLPWAFDQFAPLEDITIHCLERKPAKEKFLSLFRYLAYHLHWKEKGII